MRYEATIASVVPGKTSPEVRRTVEAELAKIRTSETPSLAIYAEAVRRRDETSYEVVVCATVYAESPEAAGALLEDKLATIRREDFPLDVDSVKARG